VSHHRLAEVGNGSAGGELLIQRRAPASTPAIGEEESAEGWDERPQERDEVHEQRLHAASSGGEGGGGWGAGTTRRRAPAGERASTAARIPAIAPA
jgi:hypothetical protein